MILHVFVMSFVVSCPLYNMMHPDLCSDDMYVYAHPTSLFQNASF